MNWYGDEFARLKEYLILKADQYNCADFIEADPISVPHQYTKKQDIEIAGFLTATIAWGNRKSIISSANKMMEFLDQSPFDFVMNSKLSDQQKLAGKSVHRTFSGEDLLFFLQSLKRVYLQKQSMEAFFSPQEEEFDFYDALERFRNVFLAENLVCRTAKHISSTYKNSAAKRLMMYLRWMVRNDSRMVDFGIWQNINPAKLSIPLDVHSGNIARKLGLLQRRQTDWKAVRELDLVIRKMDSADPAKFDFALFGIGVNSDL